MSQKIGAIARPKTIIFTDDLPKTRSGKIMRRLLRDVAEGRDLGDTTTLADAAVVEEIKRRAAAAPPTRSDVRRHTPDNWRWRSGPVDRAAPWCSTSTACSPTRPAASTSSRPAGANWNAFFEACGDDPLIDDVARLLELLDAGPADHPAHRPPVRVQPQTLAWLQRYELRWDLLIMRDYGDYSAAREFKQDTVHDLRRTASTCGSPSRTTAATSRCSAPRASPASTSTPATTTDRAPAVGATGRPALMRRPLGGAM